MALTTKQHNSLRNLRNKKSALTPEDLKLKESLESQVSVRSKAQKALLQEDATQLQQILALGFKSKDAALDIVDANLAHHLSDELEPQYKYLTTLLQDHLQVYNDIPKIDDLPILAQKYPESEDSIKRLYALVTSIPAQGTCQLHLSSFLKRLKDREFSAILKEEYATIAKGEVPIDRIRDWLLTSDEMFLRNSTSKSMTQLLELDKKKLRSISNGEAEKRGTQIGIKTLDMTTTGVHPGQFWMFGGENKTGKSLLLQNICGNLLQNDKKVIYYNLEMTEEEWIDRFRSIIGVMPWDLKKQQLNSFSQKIKDYHKFLSTKQLNLVTDANLKPGFIAASIEGKRLPFIPDVIIVDHISRMNPTVSSGSDFLDQGAVARELKNIALKYKIPIIGACQLNRDANTSKTSSNRVGRSIIIPQEVDYMINITSNQNTDTMELYVASARSHGAGTKTTLSSKHSSQPQGCIKLVDVTLDLPGMEGL